MRLGAVPLASLLVIPGNLWLASQVLAQSDAKTIEDKQLQEFGRSGKSNGRSANGRRNNCKIPASAGGNSMKKRNKTA
jgi:hypothetical protein